MNRTLRLFFFLLLGAFAAGVVLFVAIGRLFSSERTFASLPRMFTYHESHPYQYLLVVAVCFASLATAWVQKRQALAGWQRHAEILGLLTITILTASIPGGVLWKIHDMQAGYFPSGPKLFTDLASGAIMGLQVGWLIVAFSFPYNIACAAAAHSLVYFALRCNARICGTGTLTER